MFWDLNEELKWNTTSLKSQQLIEQSGNEQVVRFFCKFRMILVSSYLIRFIKKERRTLQSLFPLMFFIEEPSKNGTTMNCRSSFELTLVGITLSSLGESLK